MSAFTGQRADGHARQHNGDVYNNNTTTYNTDASQRRAWSLGALLRGRESRKLNEQLLQAVQERQIHRVQYFLGRGADANARDPSGVPALFWAIHAGRNDSVQALLSAGADVDAFCRQYTTISALFYAVEIAEDTDKWEIVETLIRAGANVRYGEGQRNTPLHLAARAGKERVVAMMIEAGADINCMCKNSAGSTALYMAAEAGRWDCVETLIRAGTHVGLDGEHHPTVLHLASAAGNSVVVAMLIAAGADVNCEDPKGNTPMHLAAKAYKSGSKETVDALLLAGAEVNHRDGNGRTSLHFAVCAGSDAADKRIILALIEAGAEVDSTDCTGKTALHYAARSNKAACVLALVAAGADIDCKDESECTALVRAAASDSKACVDALISVGSKPSPEDLGAQPATQLDPLYMAIIVAESEEIFSALIAAGADVNYVSALQCDRHDTWPYLIPYVLCRSFVDHLLAQRCVQVLHRSSTEDSNSNGATSDHGRRIVVLTLLQRAIATRREGVVEALLKAGARLGTKDMACAALVLHPGIVKKLLFTAIDINVEFGGKTALGWLMDVKPIFYDGDGVMHKGMIDFLRDHGARTQPSIATEST